MKRILLLGLIFSIIVIAGCGPTAHIEKAGNVDFSKYHTFAWAQKDEKASQMGFVEQRIRDAVTNELETAKGWKEVKRNPDVILSYDVLVERGSRIASDPMYSWGGFRAFYNPYARRFYRVYYPSTFVGYDSYRVPVKDGTITITMADAANDRTILQGWATDEIDSRRLTTTEANKIVKAIFKKWNSRADGF